MIERHFYKRGRERPNRYAPKALTGEDWERNRPWASNTGDPHVGFDRPRSNCALYAAKARYGVTHLRLDLESIEIDFEARSSLLSMWDVCLRMARLKIFDPAPWNLRRAGRRYDTLRELGQRDVKRTLGTLFTSPAHIQIRL
jgi:hypothetical protein